MNSKENARTEQPEQSAASKYEQEIAEVDQAESQRSAEAKAQEDFDLDTLMIESQVFDNWDPPSIIIWGNYNRLQSTQIWVNGNTFDRDGASMEEKMARLWANYNFWPLWLEVSLLWWHQKVDYQYLQWQTSRFAGYGGGGEFKISLGMGGRRCIQCDTWSNRGIGAFAALGITKIRANGQVVCDCPGNVLHSEKLTLNNTHTKLGVEIETPSGVRIQWYRQKTSTGYAFWNDDFRLYMQGRWAGVTIPLSGRD
jgi:hypothetical protein